VSHPGLVGHSANGAVRTCRLAPSSTPLASTSEDVPPSGAYCESSTVTRRAAADDTPKLGCVSPGVSLDPQ